MRATITDIKPIPETIYLDSEDFDAIVASKSSDPPRLTPAIIAANKKYFELLKKQFDTDTQ